MGQQKPSLGRVVLFSPSGTTREYPALVTCPHNDTCVNLQAFPVSQFPSEETSVTEQDPPHESHSSWRWPPRV